MRNLKLFGGLSIDGKAAVLAGAGAQRRRLALLALLAGSHRHPISRDKLTGYLWPERDDEHARNLLSQAVHALRRVLGADAIVSRGQDLWLNPALVSSDVAEFEGALAAGELERGVALYAGPFLDGFFLPGAPAFDSWVEAERDRLHRAYLTALEELAERASARDDLDGAVGWWRRLSGQDACSSRVTLRLMTALEAGGDRAGALEQARLHGRQLREKFGAEPDAEVVALAERIRTGREAPLAPAIGPKGWPASAGRSLSGSEAVVLELPLVGREPEWQQLQAAWREAVRGRTGLVLVTGEAGIGKTRLAEELLAWTARQGVASARTRCYAAEGRLAYGPITELLRSSALRVALRRLDLQSRAELARVLPELLAESADLANPSGPPLAESWQRRRLFDAMVRAVLAAPEPLLLLLDDLQWCDQESLEWIAHLLHAAVGARLLLIGTVREEELTPDHFLNTLRLDLRRAERLHEMVLRPLDRDQTAALARCMVDVTGDQAARLYRATEGNPLFVVESLRAGWLEATEAGDPSTPTALHPGQERGPLPPKVQAVISYRLARLSGPARELAELAATVGRHFTIEVLSRASEDKDSAVVRALDELWRRRIVRDHGVDAYDFTHDRLREAAYAEISPARRRLLHRRVAEALEAVHGFDLEPVSGQLAAHCELAGLREKAVRFRRLAAEVAQRSFAHEEAIHHLTRALQLLEALPQDGSREEHEVALQSALGCSLAETRGWAAPEVGPAYSRALALLERNPQPSQLREVLWGLQAFHCVRAELRKQREIGHLLLHHARNFDDEAMAVTGEFVLGISRSFLGEIVEARDHLEQVIVAFDPRAAPVTGLGSLTGVFSLGCVAHDLWLLGHQEQALNRCRQALALADELGHPFGRAAALDLAAILHQFRGEPEAARARVEEALSVCETYGIAYYRAWAVILLGWTEVMGGEPARGTQRIQQGLEDMVATGAELRRPYYLSLLADAYARAGRVEESLATLSEALEIADRNQERWWAPELHRLTGELLCRKGDQVEGERCFRRALDLAGVQQARAVELRAATSLGLRALS
jgi:DNA-binding SARP family transcriptional activator/predicted ATPase